MPYYDKSPRTLHTESGLLDTVTGWQAAFTRLLDEYPNGFTKGDITLSGTNTNWSAHKMGLCKKGFKISAEVVELPSGARVKRFWWGEKVWEVKDEDDGEAAE